MNNKLKPADKCIFCEKPIREVGGKRLVATTFRGIVFRNEDQTNVKCEAPRKGYIVDSSENIYMNVWGEQWDRNNLDKAKRAYLRDMHPWFCQICGDRTCSVCGSPIISPMGSDVLFEDGSTAHSPVLAMNSSCINPSCEKYRKWGESNGNIT